MGGACYCLWGARMAHKMRNPSSGIHGQGAASTELSGWVQELVGEVRLT